MIVIHGVYRIHTTWKKFYFVLELFFFLREINFDKNKKNEQKANIKCDNHYVSSFTSARFTHILLAS